MKKLKFLLLGLITPLFLGVSFALDQIFNDSNVVYSGTLNSSFTVLSDFIFTPGKSFCLKIDNIEDNYLFINQVGYCGSSDCSSASTILGYFGNGRAGVDYPLCFSNTVQSKSYLTIKTSGYSTITPIYKLYLLSKSDSSSDCSQDSNYLQCLDRVNTLNGQVGTLSGSLQSCQSDLASCTNSCDVSVSQCRESLSGCQSDLTNMTNYNDSLNSQLQECLANSPIPDTPCEGTGCDEIISGTNTMFSMFRSVEDMMYSLPLSNNIYLPRGYRGYVDSGVVAIGEIEKKKIVIDDDSFNEINKSYYKVFAGLIFLFLTALFTYYLKKFITKFFIPKS